MGIFKKIKKAVKKVFKTVTKPVVKILGATTKPIRQAIGGVFKGIIPKIPDFPDIPSPASAPTFAQAGGPAARSGVSRPNIGLSLISSGAATGLTKRAKTKKRTLIGGA